MALFTQKGKEGQLYICVTGPLVKDAVGSTFGAKNTPKCSFSVRYGQKPPKEGERKGDGLFMSCVCYGPRAIFASMLEKGDRVLVTGHWSTRQYTAKDGAEKTWSELEVDFIIPQPTAPPPPSAEPVRDDMDGTEADDGEEAEFDYIPGI